MSEADHNDAPKRRQGVKADINVTPLVDVVLVLLIIFMVVTPQMEKGAQVELPKAHHPDEKTQTLEPAILSLTAQGQVYLEKELLREADVESRLKALRQAKPQQKLLLKADKKVPYGKVRGLFHTCQQLEFPGVSLQVAAPSKT